MKILMSIALMLVPWMAAEEEGFQSLFDGKTLKGWDGDPRLWSVNPHY